MAQIITFGTLQARAVLRDVGPGDAVAPGAGGPAGQDGAQQSRRKSDDPRESHRDRAPVAAGQARKEDASVAAVLETALRLEGLYRNASTHAAGIVIGDRNSDRPCAALPRSPLEHIPATQYNMKWVESAGLVKFDFLGLKTLTVIEPGASAHLRKRGAGTRYRRPCRWMTPPDLRADGLVHRPRHRRVSAGKPGHARHRYASYAPAISTGGGHRPDLPLSPGANGQHSTEYVDCKMGRRAP